MAAQVPFKHLVAGSNPAGLIEGRFGDLFSFLV
jgi:hypothetical protein